MFYSPKRIIIVNFDLGEDNDCRGKQFILEFEINNVEASRQPGFFVDQNQGFCKANFPGVQPYRYSLVHDHDYAAAVARVMQSPDCVRPPHVMEIDHNEASLQRTAMTVPVQQQPKKYFTSFNEENFKLCEDHFSNPEELLQGFYKAWLDVKPEQDKCLITCRVCRKYFESGSVQIRNTNRIFSRMDYFLNHLKRNTTIRRP